MRIALAILALFITFNARSQGSGDSDSPEALGQWVTYFYKQPEPDRVGEAVLTASRLGFFKDGKATPPFFGFLAGAFAKYPSALEAQADKLLLLPDQEQAVLVLGLWYAGSPESTAAILKYRPRLPSQDALVAQLTSSERVRITDLPLEQGPWVLDALWGYFMATGAEAPVIRIMSALPWATVKGDTARLLVGGAARWSLISNAVQHPRVLEICRAQVRRQPKRVAVPLAEVIREAEKDLREAK